MLSLTATETIRGVASAATAITYTLLGDEVSAGSDTFKVLAQGQLPSSIGTLYTVPASTMALVKSIHLANPTASDRTAQLNVNGTAGANVVLPPTTILAGGFATYDGRWTFYNAQGQALGVGATGATGDDGAAGVGVPVGGTTGQRLAKASATDYDTEWVSAGAATVDVQEGGSSVVATAGSINFDASDFNITDEGSGVAGVALAAGGGGGGGSLLPLDAAAAAGIGSGDDFAGTTLDGGWSDLQSTAVTSKDRSVDGYLILKNTGNTSDKERGIQRAFSPAGDFTVWTKINFAKLRGTYPGMGLFVGASDPSDGASGKRLSARIYGSTSNPATWNLLYATFSGGTGSNVLLEPLNNNAAFGFVHGLFPLWMAIKRVGSTLSYGLSQDGVAIQWHPTTTTISFTVATCGIYVHENTNSDDLWTVFDYIATDS